MLYHLITLNPNKDITLHVSANNSAMVLTLFFFDNTNSELTIISYFITASVSKLKSL